MIRVDSWAILMAHRRFPGSGQMHTQARSVFFREVPLSQDDWSGIRKAGRQEYGTAEGALHRCRGSKAKSLVAKSFRMDQKTGNTKTDN